MLFDLRLTLLCAGFAIPEYLNSRYSSVSLGLYLMNGDLYCYSSSSSTFYLSKCTVFAFLAYDFKAKVYNFSYFVEIDA